MSETTVATPAPDSAPTSTHDIASQVIESAEQQDAQASSMPDASTESVVETSKAEPPRPPTEQELSEAARFLLTQGHKLKKDDGRDVWLPAKTVEGMLDRYVKQHSTKWEGERSTIESRAKEYEGYVTSLRAALAGDPKAFLAEIAGLDPRYQAFLEPASRRETRADDPEPQPDYDLGNGQRTYSVDGLAKREAWVRRQIERDLLGKLDERLKPLTAREQQAQQREERDKAIGEFQERFAAQMQEAQTWPHFGTLAADGSLTDFQQAVLNELKQDTADAQKAGRRPSLSLEGAYIRVAKARITEDDTTRRARLLGEINDAPRAPALPRQGADTRPARPLTTVEIARKVVTDAERR